MGLVGKPLQLKKKSKAKGKDDIAAWRKTQGASISAAAKHFGISPASV